MSLEYAVDFVFEVQQFDHIKIKGLMTIGLSSAEDEKIRKCFQLLKNQQLQILDKGIAASELLM